MLRISVRCRHFAEELRGETLTKHAAHSTVKCRWIPSNSGRIREISNIAGWSILLVHFPFHFPYLDHVFRSIATRMEMCG